MARRVRTVQRSSGIHQRLKNHCIPHEGNGYHPYLLRHHVLFGYTLMLVTVKILAIFFLSLSSSGIFATSITPQTILSLTNQTRQSLSLKPLQIHPMLSAAAQAKADDMATRGYFAHTNPDGATMDTWFERAGYQYLYAGENLAVHYESAEGVTQGWLASPSHRENIINPEYVDIGVGVASGEFEGVSTMFVVQFFGQKIPTENVTSTHTPQKRPITATVSASPPPVVKQPIIHEIAAVIPAHDSQYTITIPVDNAITVQGEVMGQQVVFEPAGFDNRWVGVIPYDKKTSPVGGGEIFVRADNDTTSPVIKSVAIISPNSTVNGLYGVEADKSISSLQKFFVANNIGNGTKVLYLIFIVFLGLLFLLSAIMRTVRYRHPRVLTHTVAVIVLACIMYIAW